MKWLLGIFFGLVSFSTLGLEGTYALHGEIPTSHSVVWDEASSSLADLNETGSRRSRSVTSPQVRQKAGRSSDRIEVPGSLFFFCRISKSYIPVDRAKALRLLFGHTIQVNAP